MTLNGSRPAAKRLLLEAVAHDVFANGYFEAQRGELKRRVNALSASTGVSYNHHPGYREADANAVYDIFQTVNSFVNERIKLHFSGSGCLAANEAAPIQINAQLWRHFEAETHLVGINDGFNVPGIYRKSLIPGAGNPMERVLDPTYRSGAPTRVDLPMLLAE